MLNLHKKSIWWTTSSTKIFEMVAPPLPLLKQKLNHMLLICRDYINHISAIYVPNLPYISPISHPCIIKSRPYFSHSNLGKTWKSGPNPVVLKQSTFWITAVFIFIADLLPLLDFLHFLGHFFGLLLWRHILISMSLVYNLPRRGRGSKLCVKYVKGPKFWCSKQLIAKGTFYQSTLYL